MNSLYPALLLTAISTQSVMAERAHSVCDILRNLAKYKDTPIVVRAQWVAGLEQNFLVDERCSGDIVLDSRRWPAAINLRATQSKESLRSIQNVNLSISNRLGAAWRVSPDVSERLKIVITVNGILRSVPESNDPNLDPSRRPLGFGHLNGFGLLLEVMSMEQPKIVERSSRRKSSP